MNNLKPKTEITIEVDSWPGAAVSIVMIASWVCGIAVAKGFWATLGSIFLPPLAWIILASHFIN